jgi:response regulator of citrate/malate metabolism
MKNILFIEDDQYKMEKIKSFIETEYPQFTITVKTSFHGGFEEIVDNHQNYDLVLLDMSMQNYDITVNEAGGDPAPLAGKSILTQMYLREIGTDVVVVTMYENFSDGTKIKDLNTSLAEEFPDNYKGYVFFSHMTNKWITDLKSFINKLLL